MLHLSPSQTAGIAPAPKINAAGTANAANSLKLNSISTSRARRTVGKSNVSKWQSVCPAEAKPMVVVSEFFIKINCSAKLFQLISVLFLLFTSRHLLHPAVWLQALYPDRFSIFSDGILYSVKCEQWQKELQPERQLHNHTGLSSTNQKRELQFQEI